MGIYVNPGNEEFKKAINSEIYVDKTMFLAFTNHNLNTEHLRQPSTAFWKIHGGQYAGCLLWSR